MFAGRWYNNGELAADISPDGDNIIWDEDTQTPIVSIAPKKLAVNIDGSSYVATLEGDKLLWSDDQVWTREQAEETDIDSIFSTGDIPPSRATNHFMKESLMHSISEANTVMMNEYNQRY